MPTIIKTKKLHCKLFLYMLFFKYTKRTFRANTIDNKKNQQMYNMQIINKRNNNLSNEWIHVLFLGIIQMDYVVSIFYTVECSVYIIIVYFNENKNISCICEYSFHITISLCKTPDGMYSRHSLVVMLIPLWI